MLIQHKAELGIKHIKRLTVVTNESEGRSRFGEKPRRDLHLFFEIEDVPTDEMIDDTSGEEKRGSIERVDDVFESKILRMSNEGMHILREHIMRI